MIIKGGSRKSGSFFARHLMKTEDNERVSIAEMKGLYADDLPEAFREMRLLAAGTRADNYFYHASINPREDERLTPEQWEFAVDRLEENLGLSGHVRFQVEHEKEGRTHRHIVWSRVDPDTMTITSDSFTYRAHDKTRAELEREFHHEPTPPTPQPSQRKSREIADWENFRAQESEIDPKEVKAEVTALWKQSDSAGAFVAALEDAGYTLCQGDRGYCILDQAGDVHSLARRIEGVKTADLKARLSGVPLDDLPTVAEASAAVRARSKADGSELKAELATEKERAAPEKRLADQPGRRSEDSIQSNDSPARSIKDLIPATYPPARSTEELAEFSKAQLSSTQDESPHTLDSWQDWAAHAWHTLRERAADTFEKVRESFSTFWQDLVKDREPPEMAHNEPELER